MYTASSAWAWHGTVAPSFAAALSSIIFTFRRDRHLSSGEVRMEIAPLSHLNGQNIRTRLPIGGCASPIDCTLACLPLLSPPYSASRGTAKPEGRDYGL